MHITYRRKGSWGGGGGGGGGRGQEREREREKHRPCSSGTNDSREDSNSSTDCRETKTVNRLINKTGNCGLLCATTKPTW